MDGPRRALWRRVRWGNVGRLCALAAAAAALMVGMRGQGESEHPVVEPQTKEALDEPGLGRGRRATKAREATGGTKAPRATGRTKARQDTGGTKARRATGRTKPPHAPDARREAMARRAPRRRPSRRIHGRRAAPPPARVAGPYKQASAAEPLPGPPAHTVVERLPNGEFTPDPGPWR